ncbi:DUF1284 domain-containing protein [Celeribacter baekdonensis]|uniref:DUF1284 domain-containing protein n=1 Tax=Celeribacter baekdonensis TaxID=875171 RepID=A0A2R4M0J5_9RHOB|nr:DUF1284 domain-containing protein [Celeribacter baekdonensis]AVW90619.1 DUF1284 domain-containing protein [Celeribacter baekdonensis]
MIHLRPHHLLCLLTYAGKGYSADFVQNYDRIAARLSAGEEIEIVDGPDDICAPLLTEDAPHCRRDSVVERDALAARDVGALLGLEITLGVRLGIDAARLTRLRAGFARGESRLACLGCDWADLCTDVAQGGFAGVRVAAQL